MSRIRGLADRLRSRLGPSASERERADAISFRLDMQTRKNIERGMAPAEARARAERELGSATAWTDEPRDTRGGHLLHGLLGDLRYAARSLGARRGFTIVAVLTLAVGIGANTAIFSVVDATMLRALPFADPERLMRVNLRMPVDGGVRYDDMVWSYPKFEALRRSQQVFGRLALHAGRSLSLGSEEGAERVSGEMVTADYLATLGIIPIRGRTLRAPDDAPAGAEPVALVSDELWRRRFGSDPRIVGARIEINGRPFTVAGILPPGFRGLSGRADLWVPIATLLSRAALEQPFAHQFSLVARLAQGVTPGEAAAAVAVLGRSIDDTYPARSEGVWRATAYPLAEGRVDPAIRRSLLVLAAAVALVLLIACVNIANLLLARAAARRREIAVRLALGAERWRLVRQLLTESVLLALCGAAASLVLAWGAVRALAALAPVVSSTLASETEGLTTIGLASIRLDGSAMLYTFGIALVTAVVFGLFPALQSTRAGLTDVLKRSTAPEGGFAGLRRLTGRGALVIVEVGLAVVLLVTSGLMIKSLGRLFETRIGFDTRQLLSQRVTLAPARYSADTAGATWALLLERVRAIPGVVAAGVGSCAPIVDDCEGTHITIGDRPTAFHVGFHRVTPGFFRALGVPVIRGRAFGEQDRRGAPRVAIVNQAAVRELWAGEDPIGSFIDAGQPAEVVGVVGDVRFESIEQPAKPAVFYSYAQQPRTIATLFVRSSGDPSAVAASVRREIQSVDRGHAVYDARTMDERVRDATSRSRFSTIVLAAFAAIALALAAIGIYGVMSLAVAQRTRELGIRLALGAEHRDLLAMVLSQGMVLAGLGGILGIGGALAASRAMRAVLYEVAPIDFTTYVAAALVLAVVAMAAIALPARRAMHVSPMEALRHE